MSASLATSQNVLKGAGPNFLHVSTCVHVAGEAASNYAVFSFTAEMRRRSRGAALEMRHKEGSLQNVDLGDAARPSCNGLSLALHSAGTDTSYIVKIMNSLEHGKSKRRSHVSALGVGTPMPRRCSRNLHGGAQRGHSETRDNTVTD